MTVAEWFTHCDDIGDYILKLEAPEFLTDATETDLNFIAHADAAAFAD